MHSKYSCIPSVVARSACNLRLLNLFCALPERATMSMEMGSTHTAARPMRQLKAMSAMAIITVLMSEAVNSG